MKYNRRSRVSAIIVSSAAALSVAALLAACSAQGGGTGASAGDKPLDIRFVSTYNGLPFYTATLCGMEQAAKDLGGEINIKMDGPSEGMNVSLQSPVLQSVIQAQPDGIVLVPADPQALNPIIQSAVDKGIAVATTDVTLKDRIDLASYTSDNKGGGKLAGEEMVKLLKESKATGPVLVIDIKTGLPVTNDRAAGFIETVKAAGFNVLPIQYNQNDPTQATTIVQSTLQAHPDLAGLFTTAEAAANGAVAGLQGTSSAGKVKVVAYDSGPVLVRAIKSGTIDATIGQGSFDEGYGALKAVVTKLRDDKKPAEYLHTVQNKLINKENIDDPEVVQKFEYPEKCGA